MKAPRLLPLLPSAAVLAVAFALGALFLPGFGSFRVVADLLSESAVLGIAALGATFVILAGGIDLSAGAVLAAAAATAAALIESHGWHPLAAAPAVLALGAAFGLLQGAIIERFRQPAFLVTLAGMFSARALGFLALPEARGIRHPLLADAWDLALPLPGRALLSPLALLWLALALLAALLARTTPFGRAVYALGSDREAAFLMGLPVRRTAILVYGLAGSASALAGLAYALYTRAGNPAAGVGLELDVIAAVVIGGTLLRGGVGGIIGTVLGVLLLRLIQTLIAFQPDLSSWWARIAVGALLLAFIVGQRLMARFASGPRPT